MRSNTGEADARREADARVVEQVLDLIGGKWKVLIMWHLGQAGLCRFGELRRKLSGITQRMLTLQLRELEAAGLVHRKVYAQVPPKTEYSLTAAGRDLRGVYMAVRDWGADHKPLLRSAPRR